MSEAKRTYYIFDLDRTLFDTALGSERLVALIDASNHAAANDAVQQIQDLTMTGASFSIYQLVESLVGAAETQKIFETFMAETPPDGLLLPGARQVIEFAETHADGWGILTYGLQEGQMLKVTAAGLGTSRVLVTDYRNKGEQIRSWMQPDGTFCLPQELGGMTVDDLVFVDDRLFSFDGIPSTVTGYWVSPGLSVLDAVEHPRSVVPIQNIADVIRHERLRRHIDKA